MSLKIIPLGDRLIVKPIDEPTKGFLELPESAKEKPQKGKVLEVGPGEKKPLIAKVGDTVLYRRGGGTPIPDGYYKDETGLRLMTEGVDTLVVISEQ